MRGVAAAQGKMSNHSILKYGTIRVARKKVKNKRHRFNAKERVDRMVQSELRFPKIRGSGRNRRSIARENPKEMNVIQTNLFKWLRRTKSANNPVQNNSKAIDVEVESGSSDTIVESKTGNRKGDMIANNGWNECGTSSCTHFINCAIVKKSSTQDNQIMTNRENLGKVE